MDLVVLCSGLSRWTVPHPDWRPSPPGSPGDWDRDVGCVLYEAPDPDEPLLLVDPLAPQEGDAAVAFWQMLDERVQRRRGAVVLVVLNSFHHRSAGLIAQRYAASGAVAVWAHADAADRHRGFGVPVTSSFRDDPELAKGIRAYSIEGLCPGESALYLPAAGALIVADSLLGGRDGGLRLPPITWARDPVRYREALRPSLRRLLALPFDCVVVSHGAPIVLGGHDAMAAAVGPAGQE
ncbi:MAG: hypothetical protein HYV63_03065 [Candidatus Schekmanbacteria bacterium]|nr:hypothetical protein [Candidatus Schekmanbacteria bacterium]